ACELGGANQARAVGVDELGPRAEAQRRPAVLGVVAALGRPDPLAVDGRTESLEQRGERGGDVKAGRLVRHSDLERSKARMRPNVPPETRVVVGEPETDQALDETLPGLIGAERRGRPGAGQL